MANHGREQCQGDTVPIGTRKNDVLTSYLACSLTRRPTHMDSCLIYTHWDENMNPFIFLRTDVAHASIIASPLIANPCNGRLLKLARLNTV